MRITGGTQRGRRLTPLTTTEIRPTSDRAREAVFNMLGQDLTGCRVLDLFAGTGAFGIDALSRGAASAVFVDNSDEAVSVINRNIRLCGFQQKSSVIRKDISTGTGLGGQPGKIPRFDVVFIDPPYKSGLISRLCRLLVTEGIIDRGGRVVVETARGEPPPEATEGLEPAQVRTYGNTRISIFFCEDK